MIEISLGRMLRQDAPAAPTAPTRRGTVQRVTEPIRGALDMARRQRTAAPKLTAPQKKK